MEYSATLCKPSTHSPHGSQELWSKGAAGATRCARHCGIGLLALGMQTTGPRSVAAVQCVSGSLIPSPASSQQLQRLCGGACDGASHRVHERVDVFGLLWAWQWHGPGHTLQDTMVWAHESCQRGVVWFPLGGLLQMSHLAWLLCCVLRFAGGQRHLQRESCKSSTSSPSHLVLCSPLHSSLEHGAGRGDRQHPMGSFSPALPF